MSHDPPGLDQRGRRAGVEADDEADDELVAEPRAHVAQVIAPITRPTYLLFRMTLGDTTTLADASVVDSIRQGAGSAEEG